MGAAAQAQFGVKNTLVMKKIVKLNNSLNMMIKEKMMDEVEGACYTCGLVGRVIQKSGEMQGHSGIVDDGMMGMEHELIFWGVVSSGAGAG